MDKSPVVVSGASGLIGNSLVESLREDGVPVLTLVRRPPESDTEIRWDPTTGTLDPKAVAGARAIVNLNGASIGKLPWTRQYRSVLRSSRIDSTRTLAATLDRLGNDAPALISASAVGFYGDRPGEVLTESARPGSTFLARLCVEWEKTALLASPMTRVALLRTAPVLNPDGMLKPMIALTKAGLGGPLGTGAQVWPWISLEDEVRAIRHVIDNPIVGPVNLTGPTPATQNDIGKSLADRLGRPYFFKTPAFLLRGVLGGDTADSLLLSDADVRPEVLLESGFTFTHQTPQQAIRGSLR